jgi:hypothetical protein
MHIIHPKTAEVIQVEVVENVIFIQFPRVLPEEEEKEETHVEQNTHETSESPTRAEQLLQEIGEIMRHQSQIIAESTEIINEVKKRINEKE